jgi:protein SCO1/2
MHSRPGKTRPAARRRDRPRAGLALRLGGGVAVILLAASLLLWLNRQASTTSDAEAHIGGPFSLVDDHGAPVTERSFPGKYLVVYFGYTKCPDICPATLNTLAASLSRLGRKADLVQPLFITIDPARDTPERLHRYVTAFSSRLIGLSGTRAELDHVADAYHVLRDGQTGAIIDHSSVLYLMAPDGSFVAPIPADASEMVMATAIERYLAKDARAAG